VIYSSFLPRKLSAPSSPSYLTSASSFHNCIIAERKTGIIIYPTQENQKEGGLNLTKKSREALYSSEVQR